MTPAQSAVSQDADELRREPDPYRTRAVDDGPWHFDPETGEAHPRPICYREPGDTRRARGYDEPDRTGPEQRTGR